MFDRTGIHDLLDKAQVAFDAVPSSDARRTQFDAALESARGFVDLAAIESDEVATMLAPVVTEPV